MQLHNSLACKTKPPWHSANCNTCQFVCMHIWNSLVLHEKTPPTQQVAVCDVHYKCKWSTCASWWKEKHHQLKLQTVNTILGISRNEMQQPILMQVAQLRARSGLRLCVSLCKLQFAIALAHLLMCTHANELEHIILYCTFHCVVVVVRMCTWWYNSGSGRILRG